MTERLLEFSIPGELFNYLTLQIGENVIDYNDLLTGLGCDEDVLAKYNEQNPGIIRGMFETFGIRKIVRRIEGVDDLLSDFEERSKFRTNERGRRDPLIECNVDKPQSFCTIIH